MMTVEARMQRPQRWDVPFDEFMDDGQVDVLLTFPPFRDMDPQLFPRSIALSDIVRNDTRLWSCNEGDIVIREGDYGSSAFLILTGSVRVILESLTPDVLGRLSAQKMTWWETLSQAWRNSRRSEVRRVPLAASDDVGIRQDADGARIFLQDFPGVLNAHRNLRLPAGELFGELAALSRTPRTATVVAEGDTQLLEIRWQGLRDMMRYAPGWKEHVNRLYRENSLQSHLRETTWLQGLPIEDVRTVADATTFETYGEFEWNAPFQALVGADPAARVESEPLIEAEGSFTNGLLLIRSGFARMCRGYGHGQRTSAYLGKGDAFGLAELAYNWKYDQSISLQHSLRAVGYIDVLRIPAYVVEKFILPRLKADQLRQLLQPLEPLLEASTVMGAEPLHDHGLDVGLLEFLLDHRINNGAQTMLIDLNRCTRCDDCVRACASTHDNNPRFVRQGPQHENVMVTHACMHCTDPVCMIGCPTGAISRDMLTGTVRLNDATCIGCGMCASSCPYRNILLIPIRDAKGRLIAAEDTGLPIAKATKCDLCASQPLGPACQRACPHDALMRMDMRNLPRLRQWLTR